MTAESVASPAGVQRGSTRDRLLSPGALRALVYASSITFAVVWTLALGKDVHWDALNYHLYLGFSALNDRFTLDFFGAGPPSYINPYAYVPLYLMSSANWSAMAIAVTLAVLHALVLCLTFDIAMVAGAQANRRSLAMSAVLATVLAASNPVLLQGLGSTMTDLSTGVLVLGGWLAIAHALRNGSIGAVLIAGALCGAAAALKLSNAVFAMAAVPALLFVAGTASQRFRCIAAFCLSCGAVFAVVALPWSWQLWREFGNPLFPFLNHWFQSPDFVTSALRYERFIPATWADFAARPFALLSAATSVHTEPRAPDLRYAALIVALCAWAAAAWLGRRRAIAPVAKDAELASPTPSDRRVLCGMLAGLAVAWLLWLAISGNSRYFVPMACVASVALALVLQRLHAYRPSLTVSAVLLLLAVQMVQIVMGSDWRREGGAWDGPWLRVDVPQRLREQPYLYLSAGFLTGSAFMPYVHSQSGMINIGGFNIIGPRHPGGARAQALIDRNIDRLRILVPLPAGIVDRATLPNAPTALDIYVRRLGLKVDPADCEFPRVQGNVRGERRPEKSDGWKYFVTCRLVSAPENRLAFEREVAAVDQIFDRVEDACPSLFHPRRPATQEYRYWARTYHMGSEMQLFIDEGRVKYFFPLRGGDPIDIGAVEDWERGTQPFDCSRRTSPAVITLH